MVAAATQVIAAAREACQACPYLNVCPVAPLFLQTEAPPGGRRAHPHGRTLQLFLERLRAVEPRPERALLAAMGGEDEGHALVAGCLLSQAFWDDPEPMRRLLEGINARGPQARALVRFEEHVQRSAALVQDPAMPPLLRGRFRLKRPDREVTAYETVRLVSRLLGGETPAVWWVEAVDPADRPAFEASFQMREKDLVASPDAVPGEDSLSGRGALDLFFTARAGRRSAVFYYRRDGSGKHAIVSIEGVRPDSLLKRLFKVFDTDAKKTHRIFAKICRFLNNGYKGLDKKMLWEGIKGLEREQLIVLALYAPRLAKYIEKRVKFPGLYRLTKFLHQNVADEERPNADNGDDDAEPAPKPAALRTSHEKIFERRKNVGSILETYGKETFKDFCRYVFRIAEAYRPGPAYADLIYRIGEVAYFLTAVEGFNPKGLELSLGGKNPIAFIAYGLQPVAEQPARRLQRLQRAREAMRALPGGGQDLIAAVNTGIDYLAKIHGYSDGRSFERQVAESGPTTGARAAAPGASPGEPSAGAPASGTPAKGAPIRDASKKTGPFTGKR